MLGYALGFHIVKDCVTLEGEDTLSLLPIDAKEILNKAKHFIYKNRSSLSCF